MSNLDGEDDAEAKAATFEVDPDPDIACDDARRATDYARYLAEKEEAEAVRSEIAGGRPMSRFGDASEKNERLIGEEHNRLWKAVDLEGYGEPGPNPVYTEFALTKIGNVVSLLAPGDENNPEAIKAAIRQDDLIAPR
jgi:hypothetical protein